MQSIGVAMADEKAVSRKVKGSLWILGTAAYVIAYLLISRGGSLEKAGLKRRFSYLPYSCGIFGDPPGIDEHSTRFYLLHGCDFLLIAAFYPVRAVDHYFFEGPRFI